MSKSINRTFNEVFKIKISLKNNIMVRKERLELSQVALLAPKTSASTNSATLALIKYYYTLND